MRNYIFLDFPKCDVVESLGNSLKRGGKALKAREMPLFMVFLFIWTTSVWPQKITQVEVNGNLNTDSFLISSTSGISVGEELSVEKIQNAIKRIYNLGLFSDVEADVEEEAEGVKLRFVVKEHPLLSQLHLVGNKKISSKELEKELQAKPGEILSPQRAFEWKRKVTELYKDKGYLLAQVEETLSQPDGNGRVRVTLRISEGERVRIKEINIVGNHSFSDRAIEKNLKNKEKTWYRSGRLNEVEFQEDLGRIEEFYRKRGFVDVRVDDYRTEYDEGKEWAAITIEVDEGRKYWIGKVDFWFPEVSEDGDTTGSFLSEERLRSSLKFGHGDAYNAEQLEATVLTFYERYAEEGYIYCQVEPQESRRDSLIDVTYVIREGVPAHVRRVVIEGNQKTYEKVIRRELFIYPGDLFKRSKVVKSQRAVYNLGFFQDVKLDSRPVGSESQDIDLIFEVVEKAAGQVSAGAGYSQTDGLTGNLSISIPNILGRGQNAYLRLEKGGRVQNVELGFTEPWFLDTPTSVGFDVFHITRRWVEEYKEQRKGFDLRLSRPIPRLEYTRLYWMYKLEEIKLFDFSEEYEPQPGGTDLSDTTQWPKRSSSTTFTAVRDSRDNVFNATMGTRTSLSAEFAGGLLGGAVDFQRYETEARWYGKTIGNFVLMLRARGGIIGGYLDPSTVPENERFRLGGIGNWGVRGYPDRSIGPKVGTRVIGGRVALVLTLEHKLPLAQNINWITFFDAGNTWEALKESQPADLKKGVGTGIRMEIPMLGVIGFDIGYGIETKSWEPHFQVGTSF